jgi:DNA-binding response OmpR family regulator
VAHDSDKVPKRVLLVEDEALVALFTADVLTEAGYDVVGPADRLESAMELAGTETLDAAVLDVNLAGVSVWPAAEVLNGRGIPFILVSGFGPRMDVPESCRGALRLGKPVSDTILIDAVETMLARK